MHHEDLPELVADVRSGYYCAEKTDGVRFLYLRLNGTSYLLDRKYAIFEVGIESIGVAEKTQLFDGELIQDENDTQPRFLIFDTLVANGQNVMSHFFIQRL